MKRSSRSLLRSESGVAMLLALTSITVLAVLAAKKANQALAELGKNAPVGQTDIDRIWQTPLVLPPPLPPGSSLVTRDAVKKLTDELELPGTLFVSIEGESGKLNLNRLVWKPTQKPNANTAGSGNTGGTPPPATPPPATNPDGTPVDPLQQMRKTLVETLTELLKQKKDTDEEFFLKYEALTAEQLIGNIQSWIDPKMEFDGENAQKQGYYRDLEPPYEIKNAPLYSVSELVLVKDIDDTLAEFLSKNFTAVTTEGINVNAVDEKIIKAIFPKISEEALKKLAERRAEGTGFNKEDDFWKFMKEQGLGDDDKKELEQRGIKIVVAETAFRVAIEAKSGDARKVWVAHLGASPPKLTSTTTPNTNNSPSSGNDNTTPVVVYLKTD